MLYELIGIVRMSSPLKASAEAKEVVSTVGKLIVNNRGVIRRIVPMGAKMLPTLMRKDQEQHFQGYHFMMLFDASKGVQSELQRTLANDPRVIRSSFVRVDTSKTLDVPTSLERAAGYRTLLEKNLERD